MASTKALGTVSALVTLAASLSEAEGSLHLSDWSNLQIPNGTPALVVDLNGDDVNDFEIYANGGYLFFDGLYSDALTASQEGGGFRLYSHGESINFLDSNVETVRSLNADNIYGGIHYVGVQFAVESEIYTGWLKFDFTDSDNSLLLSGGWESTPGNSVEAIPEPSSLVFGSLGALVLAAAWNKRRKQG